jgi:hypothetical protein
VDDRTVDEDVRRRRGQWFRIIGNKVGLKHHLLLHSSSPCGRVGWWNWTRTCRIWSPQKPEDEQCCKQCLKAFKRRSAKEEA